MIAGIAGAITKLDVALPRLDGGEMRLGETEGKCRLLFMWASW